MKDLGVVDFPELLGTPSKSPFILKVKQTLTLFFLPDRGPECANAITLY